MRLSLFAVLLAAVTVAPLYASTPALAPDIPKKFTQPSGSFDYERREVMIPMRDGVRLHTVILVPKGA